MPRVQPRQRGAWLFGVLYATGLGVTMILVVVVVAMAQRPPSAVSAATADRP